MEAEAEELESRFHHLAPWETENNTTKGVEQEDDALSFVTKWGKNKTRGTDLSRILANPLLPKLRRRRDPALDRFRRRF